MNNRYFVAVNLPEKVKAKIFEEYSGAIPENAFKVVPQENIHSTLAFVGWWPAEKEGELVEKLSQVKHSSFELALDGVDHFGYRVIWLGTTRGSEEFSALALKALAALGIKDERFHPHFTLARARRPLKKEVKPLLEKLQKKAFKETVKVESFELMQSVLKPSGPVYSRVKSFALG
jgi:2'-5' RNA ligase